ncbi:hypothetical protein H072_5106 [Dactylellina haptotyla CBS 200.50]|uniref:Uncharacterized protein n=1 Tax=Dactylellina haptotyla (strain CBS 200.50) TaxID=1284197 RepID=S8AD78_DACHA|nr:hypothetical protein H072_5106 [Dactylellina haptotyla CBS 200.50]
MRFFDFISSALALPAADAAPASQCTSTLRYLPTMNLSPTETVYLTTVTRVSHVDCSGCAAVTAVPVPLGPGPVVFKTTTTTVKATTTVNFSCLPTHHHRKASVPTPSA